MTSRFASDEPDDAVLVGRVLRPHGVRGELKVEPWSDVGGRFDRGAVLRILDRDGGDRRRTIESVRGARGSLLVKFDGVDDRNGADRLAGARLAVDEADVPNPPDGFYYHFQLVGCDVHDRTTGPLGRVDDVIEDGGGILLQVGRDARQLLIPFVDAFLGDIDIDAGRIDVDLPAGLIETCTV